jgi:hypothetical protein
MAAQTCTIDFEGHWRELNKPSIPAPSVIFCVYEKEDPWPLSVSSALSVHLFGGYRS